MSSKESLHLKLQDATVEVERLGELFLMNREQVGGVRSQSAAAKQEPAFVDRTGNVVQHGCSHLERMVC
jgi:hypothetical protein